MRRHYWLIPLAALLAVAPLVYGGPSCGKDLTFHLQSWFDYAAQIRAAAQFHHLALYPRWTFTAAYNSGEPRFTFYPPLSWMLGGLLTLVLPSAAVPAVFVWIALTCAGLSMHRLARPFVSSNAALLAACLYLSNPFMLFTVAARSALGELLAAAVCPLLFAAMLAPELSLWAIASPLALMWLSNVPGGVLGTYLFAVLGAYRLVARPGGAIPIARTLATAYALALGLAAVYLLPAIRERPLIRMADAYPPGMRVSDNLLLHRTLLPGRDSFLLQIEHLAAGMALVIAVALLFSWLYWRRQTATHFQWKQAAMPILAISATILFLLTFLSAPVWRAFPALWIVQFPWRWLFVFGVCMAFSVALALHGLRLSRRTASTLCLILTGALSATAVRAYRAPCTPGDTPAAIFTTLQSHHVPDPTEEYISARASPGSFRPDNPPFWLAASPQDYAPGTTPNLTDLQPMLPMPAAPAGAKLYATPLRLSVTTPTAAYLVLNLQDYPNWHLSLNDFTHPTPIHRPDGLIAIALPPGASTLAITWHHGWDELLGTAITLATLLLAVAGKRWQPLSRNSRLTTRR